MKSYWFYLDKKYDMSLCQIDEENISLLVKNRLMHEFSKYCEGNYVHKEHKLRNSGEKLKKITVNFDENLEGHLIELINKATDSNSFLRYVLRMSLNHTNDEFEHRLRIMAIVDIIYQGYIPFYLAGSLSQYLPYNVNPLQVYEYLGLKVVSSKEPKTHHAIYNFKSSKHPIIETDEEIKNIDSELNDICATKDEILEAIMTIYKAISEGQKDSNLIAQLCSYDLNRIKNDYSSLDFEALNSLYDFSSILRDQAVIKSYFPWVSSEMISENVENFNLFKLDKNSFFIFERI